MKSGKIKNKLKKFGNTIDTLVVDNDVYFGVNGVGIFKSDLNLSYVKGHKNNLVDKCPGPIKLDLLSEKKKDREKFSNWMRKVNEHHNKEPPVASAMAISDSYLNVFYFSNGNDPLLDGNSAGGIVEILDFDLNTIFKKNNSPYAVSHAVNDKDIFFATSDISDGWSKNGSGEFYVMNKDSLEISHLADFPASVTSLKKFKKGFIVGLKDGSVMKVNQDGLSKKLYSHDKPVRSLLTDKDKIYVGYPTGKIVCLE